MEKENKNLIRLVSLLAFLLVGLVLSVKGYSWIGSDGEEYSGFYWVIWAPIFFVTGGGFAVLILGYITKKSSLLIGSLILGLISLGTYFLL
jgi:hypothetical protein